MYQKDSLGCWQQAALVYAYHLLGGPCGQWCREERGQRGGCRALQDGIRGHRRSVTKDIPLKIHPGEERSLIKDLASDSDLSKPHTETPNKPQCKIDIRQHHGRRRPSSSQPHAVWVLLVPLCGWTPVRLPPLPIASLLAPLMCWHWKGSILPAQRHSVQAASAEASASRTLHGNKTHVHARSKLLEH